MGTIADKLNYLNTTKENIKSAIVAKGVSVSDSDTFRSYADKIADIEPTLGTKTITANGTYTATDDSLNGYSEVTVDIDDTDLYRDTTDSTYESVKTLSNCGAFPMLSLKVGIEPIQEGSGDPSPTNIRPISGWSAANVTRAGKNLFSLAMFDNNSYFTINGDGSVTQLQNDGRNESVMPKLFLKKGTYTFSRSQAVGLYHIYSMHDGVITWYIQNGSGTSRTFTLDNDDELYIKVSVGGTSGSYPFTANYMIEKGDETTIFEKFNGHTYTIDLDGTRYGGKLDVVSGELTVDRAYVDLGTLNYSYYSGNLFTSTVSDLKPVSNAGLCNALCSIYVAKKGIEYASIDGSFVAGFNNSRTLAIHDSRFTNATDFKTAMNGVQLVYELATPLTIQLTPTQVKSLLGTNNIWADTGDVGDVRYFKKVEL